MRPEIVQEELLALRIGVNAIRLVHLWISTDVFEEKGAELDFFVLGQV